MSTTPLNLARRPAHLIPCGNAVILETEAGPLLCLKAEREGKEYVHHYAVPLDPRPDDAHGMVYLDPEDELVDSGHRVSFALSSGAEGESAEPGDIFRNAKGLFIKVIEDPKTQKMFGYVEIGSGMIIRRQERGVAEVFRRWQVIGIGAGGSVSLDALRAAHADIS